MVNTTIWIVFHRYATMATIMVGNNVFRPDEIDRKRIVFYTLIFQTETEVHNADKNLNDLVDIYRTEMVTFLVNNVEHNHRHSHHVNTDT